jgi:putative acetyltransferase
VEGAARGSSALDPADSPSAGGDQRRSKDRSAARWLAGPPFGFAYISVVPDGEISIDDPRTKDVRELLERHLEFAHLHTPPEDIHALDLDGLLDPAITFFSFRRNGRLLAVGALKQLDEHQAELKSMHTAQAVRRNGFGRAMLDHLIGCALDRGFRRLSLETGSQPAFAPARTLYATAGFQPCGPFGDYGPSPSSTFMTLSLAGWERIAPGP